MPLPRRSSFRHAVAVLALFASASTPLTAQRGASATVTPRRFWGALSLGNATASLACSICRDISDRSVAAGVTVGVRQSPRMYLGLQLDGWYRYSGGQNERVYAIGPLAQYYPVATRPLFVRLGVGMSEFLATDEDDDLSSRSVAVQIGAGYDFVISRSYLLTPFASYLRGAGGRLSLNGERATLPAGVELLQYGLQITLR